MGSSARQVFMLPNEFLEMLGELKVSLALHVVLQRGNDSTEVWNKDRDAALTADLIYLAPEASVDSSCLEEPFNPARLEWVMTNVPRIKQDQLFMVQVGACGDWYDESTDTVYKTPEALRRLSKIWKIWRRHLRFSMLVRNIVTGAEALYRDIGYSAGAAEWRGRGGLLRQEGVQDLEFLLPPITDA
jgi:hypothetical protein